MHKRLCKTRSQHKIITSTKLMNLYKDILQDFDTTFIYVDCNRDVIQNREKNRGDRIKGTSINLLDKFETQEIHDIIIDSTNNGPHQLMIEILKRMNLDILSQS